MTETRGERKERTRRAILDAALELTRDQSLVALSLRQVAKEVGIVPTAFYRHFESIDALGLALVEESFASLRAMLRDVRRGSPTDIVDHSVRVLADHVRAHRGHFGFIARERVAGPRAVREAIGHELELIERELATDLARLPGTDAWSADDLRTLAALLVGTLVTTAEALLSATRPEQEDEVLATARTQLRMVIVGVAQWRSAP